jgi:hypothetical protein
VVVVGSTGADADGARASSSSSSFVFSLILAQVVSLVTSSFNNLSIAQPQLVPI